MKQRRHHRRRQAGFTLIEVLIAAVLTAIGVSGIIALYMVETRASGFSRHTGEATVLAQDEMERLRLVTTTGTVTATGIDENGKLGGIFNRVSLIVNSTTYADIRVTVSWSEDNLSRTVVVYGRRNL